MSARAQAFPLQALSSSDEQSTPPQETLTSDTTERDLKIVSNVPAPVAKPVPANDPLGAIKTMTDEEKIALFT